MKAKFAPLLEQFGAGILDAFRRLKASVEERLVVAETEVRSVHEQFGAMIPAMEELRAEVKAQLASFDEGRAAATKQLVEMVEATRAELKAAENELDAEQENVVGAFCKGLNELTERHDSTLVALKVVADEQRRILDSAKQELEESFERQLGEARSELDSARAALAAEVAAVAEARAAAQEACDVARELIAAMKAEHETFREKIDLSAKTFEDILPGVIAKNVAALKEEMAADKAALLSELYAFAQNAVLEAAKGLPAPPSAEEVAALIPAPKNGEDGTSVTVNDVREVLQVMVEKATQHLAMPSAEAVAEALEGKHVARWALDFERRAQDLLQRTIDRWPKPRDGVDGLGFEDMEVEYDGARGITLSLVRGERRKDFQFRMPVMLYKDIYRADLAYEMGDVVTWAGSAWIALKDAPQGSPGRSHDWRLLVKKGRDGSDK